MSFIQALLIALWAGFCSYDDVASQMFRRPLLVGPIVGLILGDLTNALIVSATLELMWMGLGNMAGYTTPDMIIGTIVGVTFSITTGQGIAAGVAIATTVAILSQQLLTLVNTLRQFYAPWADRLALTGNFDSLNIVVYVSAALQFLIRAVPTFIVVYFGTSVIDSIINTVPASILTGLKVASGILPAVGLSILMTLMMKKGMWAFLIFGFTLSTYLNLAILPVTLISIVFATLYSMIMESKHKKESAPKEAEGEYDL